MEQPQSPEEFDEAKSRLVREIGGANFVAYMDVFNIILRDLPTDVPQEVRQDRVFEIIYTIIDKLDEHMPLTEEEKAYEELPAFRKYRNTLDLVKRLEKSAT